MKYSWAPLFCILLIAGCGKGVLPESPLHPLPKEQCLPQPVADAGPDQFIVIGFNLPTAVIIGTPAVAGMSYSWNNGALTAQQIVSPKVSTKYTLTAMNSCGAAKSSVMVRVYSESNHKEIK